MKTKFIAVSLIAINLVSISCRQDDEMLVEQEELSLQPESQMAKDSVSVSFESTDPPKDPPRDGTHWRTSSDGKDSIKVTPKTFTGLSLDAPVSSTEVIDNGPKDPPKDGTHWRSGN